MSQSTRAEVDRLLALAGATQFKIRELSVMAMTALPDEHMRLHREIGLKRSLLANYDARLQELQRRTVA